MLAEGAAPAGDLSEEVDEVQSCSVRLPGEEEGYDADSESNPEDMAWQEEGRTPFSQAFPQPHRAPSAYLKSKKLIFFNSFCCKIPLNHRRSSVQPLFLLINVIKLILIDSEVMCRPQPLTSALFFFSWEILF